MMEPVWIAFSCGIFLGTCIGVLGLGLLYLNKDNDLIKGVKLIGVLIFIDENEALILSE